MRSLLILLLLAHCSIASGQVGAPPVIELPPDERAPQAVFMAAGDGADWGVLKLNSLAAHKVTRGKGVRVAVLDTGTDTSHPDLSAGFAGPADAKDFTGSRTSWKDVQGHGSHCAGRVLARGTNHGVAPEASLIVGKVLDDNGRGSVVGIAAGIRWAAIDRNVDVISGSLGGPGRDPYIPPALAEAEAAGVILVFAAGNEGPGADTVGFPGGYSQCVCVGATDIADRIASFSSRGAALFTAAPGDGIRSQYPGGRYATMSGTSMATPHVAGLAALWVAAHPEIPKKDRPRLFREALKAACKDLGPVGRDTMFGWGLPDAVKLVSGTTTPPPPAPGYTGDVSVVVSFKDGVPVSARLATPAAAAPPSGTIRVRYADGREADMDRATWDTLPGVTPQLQPAPTPIPPALAVPRYAAPVPAAGCSNGRCPLAW